MAESKRYEMLWDCPGCDSKGLLGLTHRHCPSCGAAQDATRRYFPPDDKKVAVEDHPYQGVDVKCPGCDSPNAAKATFCVNCGSPLDEAAAVAVRAQQAAAVGGTFAEDSAVAAKKEAEATRLAARAAAAGVPGKPPRSANRGKWLLGLGGGGLALTALIGVLVALFWTREATVTATGHSWNRSIAIERYSTVSESAWQDQVPGDARGRSCRQEQRSTKQVPDGQECHDVRHDNGDGTFSSSQECSTKYRSEPVYDQKCSYQVDRWHHARDATTSGGSVADAPRWAEVALVNTGALGSERESGRSETYTLRFRDDEQRDLTCDLDQVRWTSVGVDTRWKAQVGVIAASIDCDSLQGQ